MGDEPIYDRIGVSYSGTRREDPRIARVVRETLGDARSVVNVGAGTGSYEPADLEVVAVEPSATMREQRPLGSAPVVDARAEALPFDDDSFDAAMAVLSDHHWEDRARGLRELRRAARRRCVLVTWDAACVDAFWLLRDYLPSHRRVVSRIAIDEIARNLGGTSVRPLPVPADCTDRFLFAWWARPEALLDERCGAASRCFGSSIGPRSGRKSRGCAGI